MTVDSGNNTTLSLSIHQRSIRVASRVHLTPHISQPQIKKWGQGVGTRLCILDCPFSEISRGSVIVWKKAWRFSFFAAPDAVASHLTRSEK